MTRGVRTTTAQARKPPESGDLHMRVPVDVWIRLRRFHQRMAQRTGVRVTMTRAALKVLEKGLEAHGL